MNNLEEKFAYNIGTDFLVKMVRSGTDIIILDQDPDPTRSESSSLRAIP
jgi:hypothetical protein